MCNHGFRRLTKVYEPLMLNCFMILTKFGKQEEKERAALSSSIANSILMLPLFCEPTSSSMPFLLRTTVSPFRV